MTLSSAAAESLAALEALAVAESLAALEALEARIGRESVNALIDRLAGQRITFADYPRSDGFLLDLRETVNEMLG